MRHQNFNQLSINGQAFEGEALLDFVLRHEAQHIRDMYSFLASWLNEDEAITVQTSGSTGNPKTIQVLKSQMLQSAAATAQYFNFQYGQRALLALPIQYIAGKMMVVRAFYSQLDLICVQPSSQPLAQLPEALEIDFAPLIPMQMQGVTTTKSIKNILLGGGPVSKSLEQRLQSLTTPIFHGYGMTETLSHVAIRRINGAQATPIYQAFPNVFFEVDENNCLLITVPFLEHKIYTNDIVSLINAQSFVWEGRLDNVINSGGVKLFSEKIEAQLSSIIDVPYFVAGLEDEILGQKLVLFLEEKNPDEHLLQFIKNAIQQQLQGTERPKEIFFMSQFQRTTSEKIQRTETIKLYFENKK